MLARARHLLPILALLPAAPAATGRAAAAEEPVLEKLAEGVWSMTRPNRPGDFARANNLIIVNDSDVVVVDANITRADARKVVDVVRRLTPHPVRYVVNTHWHDDHVLGNRVFADAFPGVEFIAHPATRRDVLGKVAPAAKENLVEYPRQANRLEAQLRGGKRSDGTPLTSSDSARLREFVGVYRNFTEELRALRLVPPAVLVERELVLLRGAREIRVMHLGRGNTAGDLVVWLPRERIVATGDLLVFPIPYSFGSYLGEWSGTLARVRALEAAIVMPGHGPIQRDWRYLDQVRELIDTTLAQVKAGAARGLSLEEVRRELRLEAPRARFLKGDSTLAPAFAQFWIAPASERAFAEATGKLDP